MNSVLYNVTQHLQYAIEHAPDAPQRSAFPLRLP